METKTPESSICRNCNGYIQDTNQFCPHCGQKNTDGRVTIGNLFGEFMSATFNLDSKIFRTLRDLFVPGKLTIEYFKGRHKSYVHPVRLFLVTIILLIAVQFYSESNIVKIDISRLQTETVQQEAQQNEFIYFVDSLANTISDTTGSVTNYQQKIKEQYPTYKDSIVIGREGVTVKGGLQIPISKKDYITLSEEELIEKYEIKGFQNKLIFKQQVRILKDNKGFVNFFIKNSTWMLFAMMPFVALLLQLFFYTSKRFYVEHLVFTFHTHAFTFLILAIAALFFHNEEQGKITFVISIVIILVYIFCSIWRVYGQNLIKTLFKTLLINILYVFVLGAFSMIALLIELMIF